MYSIVYLEKFPDKQEPKLISVELFTMYEDAEIREKKIVNEFIEKYGEDYTQYSTAYNPITIVSNGEVDGYIYIKEIK